MPQRRSDALRHDQVNFDAQHVLCTRSELFPLPGGWQTVWRCHHHDSSTTALHASNPSSTRYNVPYCGTVKAGEALVRRSSNGFRDSVTGDATSDGEQQTASKKRARGDKERYCPGKCLSAQKDSAKNIWVGSNGVVQRDLVVPQCGFPGRASVSAYCCRWERFERDDAGGREL